MRRIAAQLGTCVAMRLAMGVGLALTAPPLARPARAAEPAETDTTEASQCVACHARASIPTAFGHAFWEWRHSPHGEIPCEKCHGGDPKATSAEVAHQGALPASDPASWVAPARLATTCGTCHEPESKAYEKTVHAGQVAKAGQGATCVTCHGSMAASLPSPAELGSRCSTCHAKPYRSRNALSMLATTRRRMSRAREEIESLREKDPAWARNASERLDRLEETYRQVQLEWHTFHTDKVFEQTRDLLELVKPIHQEAVKHAEILARPK